MLKKIIQKILVILFIECFFYNLNESLTSVFFGQVEAKPFRDKDIKHADIFYAVVADDMKTRLYQMLNNDIQYQRKPLKYFVEKSEKESNYRRSLFSFLTSDHQEKHNDNISTANDNDYNDNDVNDDNFFSKKESKYSVVGDYTPCYSKDKNKSSTPYYQNSSNENEKWRSKSKYNNTSSDTLRNCTVRERRVKPLSHFYHSINVESDALLTHNSNVTKSSNSFTPFNFIVECMDDEDKCYFVNDKLEDAGNYISNIFNIYRTINVDVHILPFCEHIGGDNCNDISALTYSPSFVTLNITDKGFYSYPQALVKQFDISDRIENFANYDISLYFNTDYLRKNNSGNFLLIASHEIIHGMGFFHLITTASAAFKMSFPENRIIPQPLVHNYRTSSGNEKAYEGWIPFTVFDRYIVEVNNPNYYVHQGIQEYLEDVRVHKFLSEDQVINHFNNLPVSSDTHSISKKLVTSFTTRKALGFRTYDGEVVILQTFKEYEPMSSVSHIYAPFSCDSSFDCYVPKEKLNEVDENYLMYYSVITRSVNDLVNRYSSHSSHGFIGEKIIKILKTIGWTEKQDLSIFKSIEHDILSKEPTISSGSLLRPFNIIITIGIILFSLRLFL